MKSVYDDRYHAIVANPPYIVSPTHEASEAYRARYVSAHRRFGMGAPFTERMFELCVDGGFVAQITSNAFMKREYGAPLVEEVLPHYDMSLVIDTSGAYIPGHGTPTVILVARNQAPSGDTVRVVQSRRGEAETPKDHVGRVWSSILRALGLPECGAPGGATPVGLVWAKSLGPLAVGLTRHIARREDIDREKDAAPVAAAWITTACALHALDLCRPSFGSAPSDPTEHLSDAFAGVAKELPFTRWFERAADVNPCWRYEIDAAWSARIRSEVASVLDPASIPAEQQGRTDWIGDIYQGLDDLARKQHAFCQTPWFVAELLAGLSVGAAVETFGVGATVLDPACGTGHLLCESYARLYRARSPKGCGCPLGACPRCATDALAQVSGGDLNPVAAAIAEFRLMLAWIDAARPRTFAHVPSDLPIRIEVADALLACRAPRKIHHASRWTSRAPTASATQPPRLRRPRSTQLGLLGL